MIKFSQFDSMHQLGLGFWKFLHSWSKKFLHVHKITKCCHCIWLDQSPNFFYWQLCVHGLMCELTCGCSSDYLDRVVEEINQTLQAAGQLSVVELSKSFGLPTDFLLSVSGRIFSWCVIDVQTQQEKSNEDEGNDERNACDKMVNWCRSCGLQEYI